MRGGRGRGWLWVISGFFIYLITCKGAPNIYLRGGEHFSPGGFFRGELRGRTFFWNNFLSHFINFLCEFHHFMYLFRENLGGKLLNVKSAPRQINIGCSLTKCSIFYEIRKKIYHLNFTPIQNWLLPSDTRYGIFKTPDTKQWYF